ncbi:Predicted membrane protein [Mycobacterium sp. 283mftsu]|nr:Predicted membrane protein [Mycobacterium sp. 283mftsu]
MMTCMTEPQRAMVARLSQDVVAISHHLAWVSACLTELDRSMAYQQPAAQPVAYAAPQQYWQPPQAAPVAPPAPQPVRPTAAPYPQPRPERSDGWIGKALAAAGVAVTLIGVALLLVLAAQAGLLRPEFRVGAGAVLAAGLVVGATRLKTRPGGTVGAVALAATGIAAAYIDVVAVTTIYEWLSAPVGLVLAAVIGGGGLTLARRWDSQQLALLVLVPLAVLAPVVADGVSLLLIGFMLALSAASLPVQIGKDWVAMFVARTAVCTFPLLVALASATFGTHRNPGLAAACAAAAVLAVVGALILLPKTANRSLLALATAGGAVPVLFVTAVVRPLIAASIIAAVAGLFLAIVLAGNRLPGVVDVVRRIWAATAAVCALVAVLVAFDGRTGSAVLLAMSVVVAVAGRRDAIARWVAAGFGAVGGAVYLSYSPPDLLFRAVELNTHNAVSTIVSSILAVGSAVAVVWSWAGRRDDDEVRLMWAGAVVVAAYASTMATVTAGVLIGGVKGGFFAGHMVATIGWIAVAAALFGYAARGPKAQRSLPIGGGLALVAAAMAKLFLFDLGTLNGMFRVAVFIVVGLVLLAMGTGYARLLARQDQPNPDRQFASGG